MNHSVWLWVLIFLGSALGGGMRHVASEWIGRKTGDGFPWGTMVVNVTGALGIGLFWSVWGANSGSETSVEVRAFVVAGFLGGYTTVSSYALASFLLFRRGDRLRGVLNLVGTFVLCLIAVAGGAWIGDTWLS